MQKYRQLLLSPSCWYWNGHHTVKFCNKVFFYEMGKALPGKLSCRQVFSGLAVVRVATVRETYLENKFFPGQGKVREFCGWSGKFRKDLESQGI